MLYIARGRAAGQRPLLLTALLSAALLLAVLLLAALVPIVKILVSRSPPVLLLVAAVERNKNMNAEKPRAPRRNVLEAAKMDVIYARDVGRTEQ